MNVSDPIELREIREEDKKEYFKWINNRELVIFNSNYKPISWHEHSCWFENVVKKTDLVIFSVVHVKSQKLIGSCSLRNINKISRNAELQIRIGNNEFRNKGYGTVAVKLLIKFGFLDMNLERIYLKVFYDNFAAIKCYNKVGFVKEGVHRKAEFINGKFVDVIMMSILNSEFLK